jgi:hypothetical protein
LFGGWGEGGVGNGDDGHGVQFMRNARHLGAN